MQIMVAGLDLVFARLQQMTETHRFTVLTKQNLICIFKMAILIISCPKICRVENLQGHLVLDFQLR